MFPPPGGIMFDDRIMQSRQSLEMTAHARMKVFPLLSSRYPLLPMTLKQSSASTEQLHHHVHDAPLSLVTRPSQADVTSDEAPEVLSPPSLEDDELDDDFEEARDDSQTAQQQLKKLADDGGLLRNKDNGDQPMDLKSFMYDKKTFNCQHCKYVTDRKNNLKRHIATMHEKCGKLLECCDTVFANKAVLREHVLSNHKHGYDCRICGRNFCRKALLKRHVTVHSGQKDYVCQTCGYATSHKSNLDRHKKRHLPKESRTSHHRYPTMPHHHLSLQLPKLHPQMTIGLHVYHETYSDFLDGRLENCGAISPLRTHCGLTNELQIQTSRPYGDKNFFKKRLIYDYMFESGRNGEQGRDHEHQPMEADHNQNEHLQHQQDSPIDPSDSGSESPRDALPSRETDTTESPFVSPSHTDSPENSFEFPVFSSGETSPNSMDLELSDIDAGKSSRLFPRLHRCQKCRRVFQTQLQLAAHSAHAHATNRWTKSLGNRPLSVEFRRKPKNTRRLPSFLFS